MLFYSEYECEFCGLRFFESNGDIEENNKGYIINRYCLKCKETKRFYVNYKYSIPLNDDSDNKINSKKSEPTCETCNWHEYANVREGIGMNNDEVLLLCPRCNEQALKVINEMIS